MTRRRRSPPNLLTLDLELARPNTDPECGRGSFLTRSLRAGIGVVCTWGVLQPGPTIHRCDEGCKADRDWWRQTLRGYPMGGEDRQPDGEGAAIPGLLTWAGVNFDVPMLDTLERGWRDHIGRPHVDLQLVLAGLAQGIPAEELAEQVATGWRFDVGVERLRLDISGYKLDTVCRATLPEGGKRADMTGADAPRFWQAGQHMRVATYCIGDVALLRRLYRWVWFKGWAVSPSGRRLDVPRAVLFNDFD